MTYSATHITSRAGVDSGFFRCCDTSVYYLVFVGQDLPKVLLGLTAIFFGCSIDGLIRIRERCDNKVSKPWLSFFFV